MNDLFSEPPAIVKSADEELANLATAINAAHEDGERQTRAGLERFRAAGQRLLEAKARIGRAIAESLGRGGANVVVAAKSDAPHPKLPGTIHETAAAVEAAGGQALALKLDVRDDLAVAAAMEAAIARFGGLDALVNNAGAIALTDVEHTDPKRFDLMQSVNSRAVYVCSRAALPFLKRSAHAHVLSLCPPLNFQGDWLRKYAPYTLSKFGMTLLSLGMAEEFRAAGVAVNCLWPRTLIATAAIEFEFLPLVASSIVYCR